PPPAPPPPPGPPPPRPRVRKRALPQPVGSEFSLQPPPYFRGSFGEHAPPQNEYLILAATKSRSLTRLYWPAPPYCVYDTSKSHLERRLAPRPAVMACRPAMKLPPGPGDMPVTSCTQVAWGSRFSAPMTLLYSRRPAIT